MVVGVFFLNIFSDASTFQKTGKIFRNFSFGHKSQEYKVGKSKFHRHHRSFGSGDKGHDGGELSAAPVSRSMTFSDRDVEKVSNRRPKLRLAVPLVLLLQLPV